MNVIPRIGEYRQVSLHAGVQLLEPGLALRRLCLALIQDLSPHGPLGLSHRAHRHTQSPQTALGKQLQSRKWVSICVCVWCV